MGHRSPPSGPIQSQIRPLHALLPSLFKIHFKNVLPCTGFVLFPHQITFNLDEVFPFCSRKLTFHYTNLANTTQIYCGEPEKWCALYHCFLVLVEIHVPFASPCWYFNMALFITAWLLFAGILVRASAKHFGERCRVRQGRRAGIRMAAPIDTVMMKYRRQGPDEREDQGGWPRVPSISTHRVLLPQASVMWCGGMQYRWHSQLESCTGSALRSECRKGRATFHPSFFSVSVSWFPYVYKQMLRWFPTFQVATTCFSCSPPDLNLVVTNFIFCLHVK